MYFIIYIMELCKLNCAFSDYMFNDKKFHKS